MRTFDGLFSMEIMFHGSDGRAQAITNVVDDSRQILKYELPRCSRVVLVEQLQVVAYTATNVDQESCPWRVIKPLDEPLLDRKEAGVHPWQATQAVTSHVAVEMVPITFSLEESEKVLVSVVSVPEPCVLGIVGILPASQAGELVEAQLARTGCRWSERRG
jgi:hypothetical protein